MTAITKHSGGALQLTMTTSAPPLNWNNYLNVVGFVINVGVVFGTNYVFPGLRSVQQVSAKYDTLLTPVGFAFSIWSIIFLAQAIFVVVQLLPSNRSAVIVQQGVGKRYLGACVAQAAWVVVFLNGLIVMSLLAMLALLWFLSRIVLSQYRIRVERTDEEPTGETTTITSNNSYSNISTNDDNDGGDGAGNDEVTHEKRNRRKDYWLFIFPFQIHEAWVVVASVVNFLLLLNSFGVHSMIRLVVTFFSMALLLIVAAQYLGAPYEPNYVVPVVFVWALVS